MDTAAAVQAGSPGDGDDSGMLSTLKRKVPSVPSAEGRAQDDMDEDGEHHGLALQVTKKRPRASAEGCASENDPRLQEVRACIDPTPGDARVTRNLIASHAAPSRVVDAGADTMVR